LNFVAAYSVSGLETIKSDGLIGLSPRLLKQSEEEPEREAIILKFYEEGTIDEPMFSLYFRD